MCVYVCVCHSECVCITVLVCWGVCVTVNVSPVTAPEQEPQDLAGGLVLLLSEETAARQHMTMLEHGEHA